MGLRVNIFARMDADDTSLPTRFGKRVVYMDEHRDVTVLGSWQKRLHENVKVEIYTCSFC